MPQAIAAFDFDGTLLRLDSAILFLRYAAGEAAFFKHMLSLSPQLGRFKAGWLPRGDIQSLVLTRFFADWPQAKLQNIETHFAQTVIPKYLRPTGIARLKWHQAEGHRVILVTAAMDLWTQQWAQAMGIELVATQCAYQAGLFTGQLATPVNYGPEKVKRLLALIGPGPHGPTYAYGDTRGDRELLMWAEHGYYRPFHGGKGIP